jgi:hypothetical protein
MFRTSALDGFSVDVAAPAMTALIVAHLQS